MASKRSPSSSSSLPTEFADLLGEVRLRIRTAQVRAMFSVNAELIRLYWDIGLMIDDRQKREGWGASVIPRLSAELRSEQPELKGFSERNIKRMLAFHREYPRPDGFVPQAVAPLEDSKNSPQAVPKGLGSEKGPQAVSQVAHASLLWQIPWGHHILLIEKVKDLTARRWYMEQALANGWSRAVLTHQIESALHKRQGGAQTNFSATLPPPQSDLAAQALKDPYTFEFLGDLAREITERQLERKLTQHIRDFLLELGKGFAFVASQYHLVVGDQDFYLDLLFYHLHLRCYVVVDLKVEPFKPEFAGKMGFYVNAVDDLVRDAEHDQPTIGIVLCKEQNRVIVEYTLRDANQPIGVATYRLLPEPLRDELPAVESLEAELKELQHQG